MASRSGTPLERRWFETLWFSRIELLGKTEKPRSSMRNGYSSAPCDVPRYLMMRMRRVETCSFSRGAGEMTPSEADFYRPKGVGFPFPRPAGATGGWAGALGPRERG